MGDSRTAVGPEEPPAQHRYESHRNDYGRPDPKLMQQPFGGRTLVRREICLAVSEEVDRRAYQVHRAERNERSIAHVAEKEDDRAGDHSDGEARGETLELRRAQTRRGDRIGQEQHDGS